MSMLFISHNLNVVRKLCKRVAVMQKGVIVEEGCTDQVFFRPQHPYTQHLIECIPARVKVIAKKSADERQTVAGASATDTEAGGAAGAKASGTGSGASAADAKGGERHE